MAVRTDPRFGFKYGWESGADGWGDDLNRNLELLMLLFHLTFLDIQSTPPGSPSIGDTYFVGSSPTGAWLNHAGELAIWWQLPSTSTPNWIYITPSIGMRAWDQSGTPELKVWDGATWTGTI